jgi:hypothetical protein
MKTLQASGPYRPYNLGSLDRTQLMLIRQYQFPWEYADNEPLISVYHDRLDWVEELGGLSEQRILEATDEENLRFLVTLLKADPEVAWTGYRVLGSVNLSNGYPVYSLEVFARDPNGSTPVYTGGTAPNVKKPMAKWDGWY